MNGRNAKEHGGTTLLGLLLALGLIIGGWVLGVQIKNTRLADRYVTVKGLVERNVKSDLAIWPLSYKEAGDDLTTLYAKTEADKKIILDFLQQQSIEPSEIELGIVRVVDTQANEFGGVNRAPHRYIVDQQITVRTKRVDVVANAAQKTMQLLQKGIVLGGNNNFGQGLAYKFTALNSIKPDMITEATRNARAAADRFASDSGSKVGAIRQANQGVFSILPADQGAATGEPGEGGDVSFGADASLMKTVRVVTTVQYYLNQ
ncbi:MAG: SIMPL domain-containing protein [Candidatus Acidiferrum sp.]